MTQQLGIWAAIFIALIVVLVIFMALYLKFSARGKVAAVFLDTRRIYSMLLTEDAANKCVWRGKADNPDREKYKLVPEKSFEIKWPGGMPWFMQERLRAWIYVRNNDEPYDPSNMRLVMSARMNRMISDEALLRTMWQDLRRSTGAAGAATGPMSLQMMLFLGLIALIGGVGVVMTYNMGKNVSTALQMLTTIHQMLISLGAK